MSVDNPKTPQIDTQYSDGGYLEKNKTWHAEDSEWKARQISGILKRNNLHPALVAEVGCGAGEILVNLSQQYPDIEFIGFELSEDAYRICRSKSRENLQFHFGDVLNHEKRFDILLCIDVFEHIENYIQFLRKISAKADYCVFHVPLEISVNAVLRDTLSKSRQSVGHLHFFTLETAIAAIQDSGYEVLETAYTAPFEQDGITPARLLTKLMRYPRRLLYRMSPRILAQTLGGCSLMVLARKAP